MSDDSLIDVEIGCGRLGSDPTDDLRTGIGLDVDHMVLAESRRSSLWFGVCGDGATLPFADESISTLRLRAVLHHMEDTRQAIREFARVLRDDGELTIVDGMALSEADARDLDAELIAAGLPTEPSYGFDIDPLGQLLVDHGLHLESVVLSGTATFATPPYVSKEYTSDQFTLLARKRSYEAPAEPGNSC